MMSLHVESIIPVAGLSFRVHRWSDNLRECEEISLDGRMVPFGGEGDVLTVTTRLPSAWSSAAVRCPHSSSIPTNERSAWAKIRRFAAT